MKTIAAAFVKAQREFGPALKTHTNPAFRSKYADLSACVEAVIDALNANGIALMQHSHECVDGVLVETLFLHESGETLSAGKLHVPASKKDPQGYGSALTYARRYSLMAACGIAPEDDDGNAASKKPAVVVVPTGTPIVSEKRMSIIADVAAAVGDHMQSNDVAGAYEEYLGLTDNEEKTALWKMLDSKTRSAIKGYGESLKQEAGLARA
jgi:hypothetical protein